MSNLKPKQWIVEQAKAAKTLSERESLLARARGYKKIHPATLRKVERLVGELRP